jgi:hypothetical protein
MTLTLYKNGNDSFLTIFEVIGIEELELIIDFIEEDRIGQF